MRFAPLALSLMVAVPAASDVVEGVWSSPAADRWMYPFNSTPGTRSSLSVFGSDREDPSQFDARDGQILLAFDVADQLPSGDEALDWSVVEAEVLLEVQNDLVFRHDPTADAWTDFLPASDARRTQDTDAGQPIELAAVGFRNGWTRETFQETSPFTSAPGSVLSPAMRNAFAAQVDGDGVPQDISNHPRQGFQPAVFAVGRVDGVASGALVPTGSLVRFRIDLTLPGVQAYLRQGLRQGRLWFSVSSLSIVQQQAGAFPVFHARESALVQFGLAQAASLRVRVERTAACDAADLDCSGMVDAADIGALLVRFGACPAGGQACTGDLDGSGTVDAADIGAMLIRFG